MAIFDEFGDESWTVLILGPVAGKEQAGDKFKSIRLLDAFVMGVQKLACDDPQKHDKHEEGSEVEVEAHNQFEIFAVAAILQLKGLQLQAEQFIEQACTLRPSCCGSQTRAHIQVGVAAEAVLLLDEARGREADRGAGSERGMVGGRVFQIKHGRQRWQR